MIRDTLYRQFAVGDLVLFCALAVPGLGAWILDLLIAFNVWLYWPGTLPTSAGVYLLLHLLGLLGAALAYVRVTAGPGRETLLVTVVVKFLAAGLFALGVMAGAPAILLILGAIDLLQGLALLFCGLPAAADEHA